MIWIIGTLLFAYFSVAKGPSSASDTALAVTSTLAFLGSLQFLVVFLSDI